LTKQSELNIQYKTNWQDKRLRICYCGREVAQKALSIFHLTEKRVVYCPYCGSRLKL